MKPLPPGAVVSLVLASAAGLAFMPAGVVRAQSSPQATAAIASATLPPVEAVVARTLTRIALTDLKLVKSPGEADLVVAAELLALAASLQPADEDILRLLIEAASAAGDRATVEDATRRLLKLDPGDTVAQLSLLSANISRLQDADSRVQAYERFLGPAGAALDPALRSRLALDLALLLRERGDAQGFAERLRQATTLDPTNKDAAGLLVTFVAQRGDPPEKRLEALFILLGADPLDGHTHTAIARELASVGAAKQAVRFFDSAEAILTKIGEPVDAEVALESRIQQWLAGGAGKVSAEFNEAISQPRKQIEEQAQLLRAAGREADIAKLPKTEEVKLSPEVERVWALAASAAGDEAGLRQALEEMTSTLTRLQRARDDATVRPKEWTAEMAADAVTQHSVSLAWTRLLVDKDPTQADALLSILRTGAGLPADVAARLGGLLQARKGDPQGVATLRDAATRDPLAQVALAVALELSGSRDEARQTFETAADALRGTATAAWAADRATALRGSPAPPRDEARLLGAMADGVPRWLDQMHIRPQSFQSLQAALVADRGGPFDKPIIELSLRNMAPIPLAIGPDRPLNSRIMLGPAIDIGTRRVQGTSPEVVSLERRLRLMPGTEMKVRVWADPGYNGFLSELSAGELSRSRWRVVQGFRLNEKGTAELGPMSLATETGIYLKQTYPHTAEPMARLADLVATLPPAELSGLLGTLRWRLFLDEGGVARLNPDDAARAARALADRYAKAEPLERMLILSVLPSSRMLKALAPFDRAAAATEEPDPRVLLVKVATRATAPDDPLLADADGAADPALKLVAGASRDRLKGDAKTYSRFTLFGR